MSDTTDPAAASDAPNPVSSSEESAAAHAVRTRGLDGTDYLRVPPIPERFLVVYATAWWALALSTLISVLAGLTFAIQDFQEPVATPYGLGIDDGGGTVIVIEAYGGAEAAGLRGEDEQVLTIDGVALSQFEDPYLAFFDLVAEADGNPLDLVIEDPDGTQRELTLSADPDNIEARYEGSGLGSVSDFTIAMAVNAVFYLGLLIYAFLLFGRRREVVPQILAVALPLILLGGSLVYGHVPLWVEDIHSYAGAIGYALLMIGIVLFPNGRFIPRWSIAVVICVLAVLAYEMVLVPPDWLFSLVDMGFPLAILATLFARYRAITDIEERQQMRFAFLGISIGAFLFAVLTLIEMYEAEWLPGRFWDIWVPHILNLITTIALQAMLGGLIISLLRLRLYDADAVISRSAAVALVTLMLVAVFAAIEEVAMSLGEQYFSTSAGFVASGLAAGGAAMLIIPLHERVQGWAEKRFQGLLTSLRSELRDKVTDLRESAELEPMLAEVNNRLNHVLHAQRIATLLDIDGDLHVFEPRGIGSAEVLDWAEATPLAFASDLQRHSADLLFPARLPLVIEEIGADRLIGWIVLGPRPDGSFYNREECDALNDVAAPVARSIDVVQRRSKLDRDRLQRIETLETKLRNLEDRIADNEASAT